MKAALTTLWRSARRALPGASSKRRLRNLERAIERLSHLSSGSNATYIVNNLVLVRVVAGIHAFVFYVHADDKLLSPWVIANGYHEPALTKYVVSELSPQNNCIDVGANFGYFTCLLAKYCPDGYVFGIEPNPEVFALAQENILLNALYENSEMLASAVSDAESELTLFRRTGRSGNTSIAAWGEAATRQMREPPEEAFRVRALTIDGIRERLGGRVDFIKIDAEGAEPLILAGAKATIASNPRLRIAMEWAPNQMKQAGFDIGQFVHELTNTPLIPFVLDEAGLAKISWSELHSLPYQGSIILTGAALVS